MNIIKAQREIFDAINSGGRVSAFGVNDDKVLVTADGYMGYIFARNLINFNQDKISMINPPFTLSDCVQEGNELKITQELRSEYAFGRRNGRLIRKLKAPGKVVYVNDAFLKNFQEPRLWQEREESLIRIVVTEGQENVPVGVILPIRINYAEE